MKYVIRAWNGGDRYRMLDSAETEERALRTAEEQAEMFGRKGDSTWSCIQVIDENDDIVGRRTVPRPEVEV